MSELVDRWDSLNAKMSGQVEPNRRGSQTGGRAVDPHPLHRPTIDSLRTIGLIALAGVAGIAALAITVIERLLERPSGHVVGTFDGRRR